MRRYFPSRNFRAASRLTLRKTINWRRKKYSPPLGLVKATAVALNPNASPEEFDKPLRDVRTPETAKGYADQAYANYRQALENAWRDPMPGESHLKFCFQIGRVIDPMPLPLDTVWGQWKAKRDAQQPNADANAIKSYIAVLVHKAIMRFHMTGDPRPLTAALSSLQVPGALACVNGDSIVRLSELLDARSKPLKTGRPRGHLNRWRSARHVAAHLVEKFKTAWRAEQIKRRFLPTKLTNLSSP